MSNKRKFVGAVLVIGVVFGLTGASEAQEIRLRVSGAKVDCAYVPVCAVIELPERLANVPPEEISVGLIRLGNLFGNVIIPGQIVMDRGKAQLWWVLPEAKANKTSTWIATLGDLRQQAKAYPWKRFSWRDTESEYLDLLFGGRKVTRYMYALDRSTKQRVLETYKTFLHVFDAAGENLLTNGPDGVNPYPIESAKPEEKILYPHHRGIFIGWNRLEFDGKRYDFWHMGEQGRVQKHEKFSELTAGPVLATSNSLVHWNDKDGRMIIAEQRKTTVFRQSEPTILLLEFLTELKAVSGDVLLDGDPEHAGFQYRPHDGIAKGDKDVKATYMFHKDGIDAHKDENLPWAAMSYGLNGKRYSVLYMDCPDNPKPVIYSAYRDYGRFGAFFKKKIDDGDTLTLRYRIWIIEGQMPERIKLANKYSEFIDGPKVEILK
jgi:hypothetical protein